MTHKTRRKRRIRWGRVATLIASVGVITLSAIYKPYHSYRLWWAQKHQDTLVVPTDSILQHAYYVDSLMERPRNRFAEFDNEGRPAHNRILSVSNFKDAFPDLNDVQLATAQKLGLQRTIHDRDDADTLKSKLVFIGDNTFYEVRPLSHSIPYLIPRAERLLTEIARNFQDSLISKGLPMHKLQVSSVLRTEADVARLRRGNVNATDQSCHRFGTTFDLSYNNFTRVQDPSQPPLPENWGVQLKSVLAEVLRDQRALGTCYVKYEYKKPCFHITCR